MPKEDLTKWKKIEKVGLSISVSKENLDKLKNYMEKNDPEAPLSLPFDTWLEMFVKAIEKTEAEEKNKKEEKTNI